MRLDVGKVMNADEVVGEIHELPNGEAAILDRNDKMVAYNKRWMAYFSDDDWDWVKNTYRK